LSRAVTASTARAIALPLGTKVLFSPLTGGTFTGATPEADALNFEAGQQDKDFAQLPRACVSAFASSIDGANHAQSALNECLPGAAQRRSVFYEDHGSHHHGRPPTFFG
jgi:hypothetical protein